MTELQNHSHYDENITEPLSMSRLSRSVATLSEDLFSKKLPLVGYFLVKYRKGVEVSIQVPIFTENGTISTDFFDFDITLDDIANIQDSAIDHSCKNLLSAMFKEFKYISIMSTISTDDFEQFKSITVSEIGQVAFRLEPRYYNIVPSLESNIIDRANHSSDTICDLLAHKLNPESEF